MATITSAPAISSASAAVRGAAREITTVSGTSAAPRTSWESSGSRASESKTIRRGWRVTPSRRAVSSGSSVSAVPIPTATASHSARQWCESRRESSPEIHFESPVRVATLPSSVIADLNSTHGRPVRACLRNGWLSRRARAASSPSAIATSTPSSRRIPGPRPAALSVGSSEAMTTRRMPGLEDRLGAGRRAAGVAAGLERHVERRAAQVGAAGGGDRRALGVRPAELGMEALAEHLAVAHDHRADQRIGARAPAPALRQLKRPGEMLVVGGEQRGHCVRR